MTQYRNAAHLLMALALGSTACRSTKEDPPAPPAPLAPPPVVAPPPAPEATAAPQKPTFGQTPPEGIDANHWAVGGQCNIDYVNGAVSSKPSSIARGSSVRVLG